MLWLAGIICEHEYLHMHSKVRIKINVRVRWAHRMHQLPTTRRAYGALVQHTHLAVSQVFLSAAMFRSPLQSRLVPM